jgi:hypothetical protein
MFAREKQEMKRVPMMPVRDMVIFPQQMTPFIVGREASVRALEEALAGDKKIFLATQHDASIAIREQIGEEERGLTEITAQRRWAGWGFGCCVSAFINDRLFQVHLFSCHGLRLEGRLIHRASEVTISVRDRRCERYRLKPTIRT